MKLHLVAKVPSEGARRVAQWVLTLEGGLSAAARALGTGGDRIQRIVEGEMVPGLEVGTRLHRAAGIRHRDFHAKPLGGWFERPEAA